MARQLRRFGFTLNDNEFLELETKYLAVKDSLIIHFRNVGLKKYKFQLEQGGKKNRYHFQGRIGFGKDNAKRKPEVVKLFLDSPFKDIDIKIESEAGERAHSFYVMKQDETYRAGPWSDKDIIEYIPPHILEMKTLLPWQETMKELAQTYHKRYVDCLVDTRGGAGKSSFVMYMCCYHKGRYIPFVNDCKDLMQWCYGMGEHDTPCWYLDMPRCANKDRMYGIYSAIENLKAGWVFDMRYKAQMRMCKRPNIWVYTNEYPDQNLLSQDMWRVWKINKTEELVICENPDHPLESLF